MPTRRSKRPDPTVSPIVRLIATGQVAYRNPFTPSARQEDRQARAEAARDLNRGGTRGVKARDLAVIKEH